MKQPENLSPCHRVRGIILRCPLGRKTVLLLPSDDAFLSHATLILEQNAFYVIAARDLKELHSACENLLFQVAVLGPALGSRMKRALTMLIQEKCPDVPIIEMFSESPAVRGVIHFAGETGPELTNAVKKAIRGRPRG